MTADTKDKEIAAFDRAAGIVESLSQDGYHFLYEIDGTHEGVLIHYIAKAILSAQNDTLEEAACAAIAAANLWAAADRDPTRAGCGTEIAQLIRSLKVEV
jgi:hypothetical protein